MAYTAPAEDTICFVGSIGGDGRGGSVYNGSGCTLDAWEASGYDATKFMATDGGPVKTESSCTYTHATKTISKVGIGSGVTVGTIAFVGGTNITVGRYIITTVNVDSLVLSGIDSTGDNTDTGILIGGTFGDDNGTGQGLQFALDADMNDGAMYNRYIYINSDIDEIPGAGENYLGHITLGATIFVDTNSGSGASKIYVQGRSSDFTAPAMLTITTNSTLTDGLAYAVGVQYYLFENIIFDGGGKNASKATYGFNTAASAYVDIVFVGCKFINAGENGLRMRGHRSTIIDCEAYGNGDSGMYASGYYIKFVHCKCHDNDSHGIKMLSSYSQVSQCICTGNGEYGIYYYDSGYQDCVVTGNTVYDNNSGGYYLPSLLRSLLCTNNTSSNNGGYGWNIGAVSIFSFMCNNHSYNNTSGHCSGCSDSDWVDYANGNNITGDPLFIDPDNGDFTPKLGSPLVGAGIDAQDSGNGIIGAINPLVRHGRRPQSLVGSPIGAF